MCRLNDALFKTKITKKNYLTDVYIAEFVKFTKNFARSVDSSKNKVTVHTSNSARFDDFLIDKPTQVMDVAACNWLSERIFCQKRCPGNVLVLF